VESVPVLGVTSQGPGVLKLNQLFREFNRGSRNTVFRLPPLGSSKDREDSREQSFKEDSLELFKCHNPAIFLSFFPPFLCFYHQLLSLDDGSCLYSSNGVILICIISDFQTNAR
ncbi:hypothetical protein XENORESO_019423, partial [Xenotaenia resolanae]